MLSTKVYHCSAEPGRILFLKHSRYIQISCGKSTPGTDKITGSSVATKCGVN